MKELKRFKKKTVFHRNYDGRLTKLIQDYEDTSKEHALLGQKTWNHTDIKKGCFVQNTQNIDLVDTVFEEFVCDKPLIEACNFLRSHAIRYDQQNRGKAARLIHGDNQPFGKTKSRMS